MAGTVCQGPSVPGDRNAHRDLQGPGSYHGLELLLEKRGQCLPFPASPLSPEWGSSHLCQCGVRDPQLDCGRNPGDRGQLAENCSLGRLIPPAPPSNPLHWGLCSCGQCSWNMLVFPGRIETVTVILGAHNISARERSQQAFCVRHWVVHPKYSRVGFKNDIVLLKVWPNTFQPEGSPPPHLPRSVNLFPIL